MSDVQKRGCQPKNQLGLAPATAFLRPATAELYVLAEFM